MENKQEEIERMEAQIKALNEELEKKKTEGVKPETEEKPPFCLEGSILDDTQIFGFGVMKLNGYQTVELNVKALLNLITLYSQFKNACKLLSKKETEDRYIRLFVRTNKPLVIGEYNKTKKNVTGFALAPRIDTDALDIEV